jgi:hypothetical protein
MDSVRSERGGSAIGTAAQAQTISGDTAHGIERAMSAMEMSNAVIARTIGETLIRGIFIQLHNLLRKHHTGQIQARVGGRWITTVPSQWKERTNVSVQIGSSHAERQRQANVMQGVIALQKDIVMNGSILTDEQRGYKAVTDAVNLSGIRNPERYFIDPESPEGQQASQQRDKNNQEQKQKQDTMEQAMFQAQQKLAEAEHMKGMADIQANQVKLENERLKMQLDQAQKGSEQLFDYVKLANEVALKLTEMEQAAGADLSQQFEENK